MSYNNKYFISDKFLKHSHDKIIKPALFKFQIHIRE